MLPRISNHTDFDALRMHPDVDLKFVPIEKKNLEADLIILPGSKNVLGDLASLKAAGWEQTLKRHVRYGGKIIGICGGYQMLGGDISDPDAVETNLGSGQGFSLLETSTVLHPEKQLKRVSGWFISDQFNSTPNEATVSGYEIHCGVTTETGEHLSNLFKLDNGNPDNGNHSSDNVDGLISKDNTVMGTYLHGVFDNPEAANTLLQWAGLESNKAADLESIREQQLERLADCLEQHLDESFLDSLKAV